MTSAAEFDRHLREVKTLLTPGTAIPAWKLAYLLARMVPPDPTVDSPIYFPIPERPPLVVTMLRWVGERATKDAVSEHDSWLQQIGHIDYFVRSELAMAMLGEASRQNDPWLAAPRIRVLDAAVLLHGNQPQAGIDRIEQLAPALRTTARVIEQETGAGVPMRGAPVHDGQDWILVAQFQELMKRYAPGNTSPLGDEPGHDSTYVAQLNAILRILATIDAKQFGREKIDPTELPPEHLPHDKRKTIRSLVWEQAKQMKVFGKVPEQRAKAFERTWNQACSEADLRYDSIDGKPHKRSH